MMDVKAIGCSDIGKIRKLNEDAFMIREPLGLFVVADGMGGHKCGDVASSICIQTIEDYIHHPEKPDGISTSMETDDGLSASAKMLCQAIVYANRQIYNRSMADESCRGMGTTVSAVFFTDNTFVAANVGDSPIYMIRENTIEMISTEHNLLHEKPEADIELPDLTEKQMGHILTRAVGIRDTVNPDVCEFPCLKDDRIVICSDGLSNKIEKQEILDIILSKQPESACRQLVDLANSRGGEDNITVIIISINPSNHGGRNGIKGIFSRIANLMSSG